MPAESQPQYFEITVRCSCGNSFQTRSSVRTDFRVEICSACHPSGRVLRDTSVFAEGMLNEPARMTAQR